MVSLRTAFIESFKQGDNVFYCIMAYLPLACHPLFQIEQVSKDKKETSMKEKTSTRSSQMRIPKLCRSSPSMRALQSLVSMNINNFSHLLDHSSNDFKDCQNLVHVLELDNNEEKFSLSQVDTISSLTLSQSLPQLETTH